MELHGLFTESEADDYIARMSASVVHKQLAWWLQNNEDRLDRRTIPAKHEGGFVVAAHMFDMDADYPDLMVAFLPESKDPVAPGFGSMAGLAAPKTGPLAGKKIIVLRCLLGPNDFTNVADRFRVGFRKAFIHEFQHYLMTSRTPDHIGGSRAKAEKGGLPAYFNDNDETNAYYIEAVNEVAEFFATVRDANPASMRLFADMSTPELIAWAKEKFFFKPFLDHASPKTMRALNKRLYRFMEQSMRPMIERVLRNYQD